MLAENASLADPVQALPTSGSRGGGPGPECGGPHLADVPPCVSSELVMLLEWWSRTECTLFTDQATVGHFGKEHVVIILNHNFEIDFLCGWTMCERFGVLGVSDVGFPGGSGL